MSKLFVFLSIVVAFFLGFSACESGKNNANIDQADDNLSESDENSTGNDYDIVEYEDKITDDNSDETSENTTVLDDDGLIDITAPLILSTIPKNKANFVALNTSIEIDFSESIDESTLKKAIYITDSEIPIEFNIQWLENNNTVLIIPKLSLSFTSTYFVTVNTNLSDLAGNHIKEEYKFWFSTVTCGNGTTDGVEQCDDGNLNNNDGCKNDCNKNICGDYIIYDGVEICEIEDKVSCTAVLGVESIGDVQCNESCSGWVTENKCTKVNICLAKPENTSWNDVASYIQSWNGSTWVPDDDLITEYNTTSSTNSCQYICAANYIWDTYGNVCVPAGCGNTILEEGEECDDGNIDNEDNCKNNCTNNICGDGVLLNGVETCESGNVQSCIDALGIMSTGDAPCNNTCSGYTAANNCSKNYKCLEKPLNTEWNSVSSYIQTWDGVTWIPAESDTKYNIIAASTECRYKCMEDFTWDGSVCIGKPICTNQITCYDNRTSMNCPFQGYSFHGQDFQYAELDYCTSRNYTISGLKGSEIVTDNVTGLIWKRTVSSSKYSWSQASSYCENLVYGGYSDWHLPSAEELNTLLDYGRSNPAIDISIFPGTQYGCYWTETSYRGSDSFAWCVDFSVGEELDCEEKTTLYYVRCLRDEKVKPDKHFTEIAVDSDVVVSDNLTGLEWSKSYKENVVWQDALHYCENLIFAEKNDWRLPNINELKTLVNRAEHDPSSDFPDISSNVFWSSTSSADDPVYAWHLNFSNGRTSNYSSKSTNYYARCVRFSDRIKGYCGDGILDSDEQCDNGIDNGCGTCSAKCLIKPVNYCGDGVVCGAEQCDNYNSSNENCDSECNFHFKCTGQTSCYDNLINIDCPEVEQDFYGQDFQYNELGYCIQNNYSVDEHIVTDNVTGMKWQRILPATYAGCSNGSTCSWWEGESYCNNLDYGGYNDWHLPTIEELITLKDLSVSNPSINNTVFKDVKSSWYWTSSDPDILKGSAFGVDFNDGYDKRFIKSNQLLVMCARGTLRVPVSNFIETVEEGDTVVIDSLTNLSWAKSYNSGPTWQNALSYCENLVYAGYSDWRLPTINELSTLIYWEADFPASNFPDMPSRVFWSSSSIVNAPDSAWGIAFQDGNSFQGGKMYDNIYARCVR